MRPQQQNRRMRGRNNNNNNNNNNRKGPNPLTRNYESNGPDVKIRGSAQQIAEKYATLARDATSSGDRVMAENYLQHAEHYNRIIAAAQAQMPIQHVQPQHRDDFDDMDEDRDDFDSSTGSDTPQPSVPNGSGPQPVIEGTPAEVALNPEAVGNGEQRSEGRANGTYGEGDGEGRSRRGRRSRRGERSRFERDGARQAAGDDAAEDGEGGGDAGQAPAAEAQADPQPAEAASGEATLESVEN